jgi:ABC-type cobalamin/Fe3+-siderophores transport system ATPase subunit
MYIEKVKSNIKRGVDVRLGQHTVIVGPNGGGKSSVLQALQLAADGTVRDAEGRDELKTAAAIARFFSPSIKELYATATLSDNQTALHWEATRTKTSIKVGACRQPVHVHFPVTRVQSLLAGDEKKVRAWLSQNVLGKLTASKVTGVLTPDEAKAISRLISQKGLELDWSVIAAAAKAEATSLRRDATVKEKTVDQMLEGVSQEFSPEEKAKLSNALEQVNLALAAARESSQEQYDALDRQVRTMATDYDLLAAQEQADVPPAESATGISRAELQTIEKLHAIIAQSLAVCGVAECGVCGTTGVGPAIQARQAQTRAILEENARNSQVQAQLARSNQRKARMQQIQASLETLVPKWQNFKVVDTAPLKKTRDDLMAQIARAQSAEQTWASARAAKAEVGTLRALASTLAAAADTLTTVGQKQLKESIEAFQDAVSNHLPGEQLGVDIEAGRLGFLRYPENRGEPPTLHTALSGAEWSMMVMALCAWDTEKNPPAEGSLVVLTPDDRAWDSHTLARVMNSLYGTGESKYQVIIMSTVMPEELDPDMWTIVTVGDEASA